MSATLKSYNPANGEVVGELLVGDVDEVKAIVERAHQAVSQWRKVPIEERGELLKKAAQELVERAPELGEILSREMGKPLKRGVSEVRFCGKSTAGQVDEIITALAPHEIEDRNTRSTVYYEPLGVCAAITPWNYPMSMPHALVIPALMAGNAVVLKPSEESPLIAQAYVDVLNEFLPEHVLQIIHGADEQGKALVDTDVNLIAFTGSREVGKKILARAADGLKRVVLELGGKDPQIVLQGADIEAAAQCAVGNGFENSGQMCVSTERIYVTEDVADAFEQRVAELVGAIKSGPWCEEGVDMGPMVNETQRGHVIRQIDEAVLQGATLATGSLLHQNGFVSPSVLTGCTENMEIMREETFGPVLCIQRVKDADEAIRLANDNPYGLGASVFAEPEMARTVARELEAGMIGVNKSCFGATGSPWVGAKQSGYGFHGSPEGHRQFTQVKVISEGK